MVRLCICLALCYKYCATDPQDAKGVLSKEDLIIVTPHWIPQSVSVYYLQIIKTLTIMMAWIQYLLETE